MNFFESPYYTYAILPFLIVIARIIDVTLGTLRIIYISKGKKNIAPILGFFEVTIWLLAATRVFQNIDNWICYIAYGTGFALGSYIGMFIEEKLALGVQLIRIITRRDAKELVNYLRCKGYGVTAIRAEGSQGEVGVVYSVINRKNIKDFVSIIKDYNPNAFYTIEDIRFVSQEILNTATKGIIEASSDKFRGIFDPE
jgi:uncharacterized protein YebE (UPF0316 family)